MRRPNKSRLHKCLLAIHLALLAACGAADKMAPASVDQPGPPPAPSFAHLAIVDAGPLAGLHFEHYGVNPTVDTSEQPESRFGLRADVASFGLAQLQMAQGALPDRASIRVEDFVNAVPFTPPTLAGQPIAAPVIEAFPAPHRPGYHVLRVSLFAAPKPAPRRVVVVLEANAERRSIVIARLRELAGQLAPGDELAVVHADGQVALAPTPAGDPQIEATLTTLRPRQSDRHAGLDTARGLRSATHQPIIVYVTDGLAHRGHPSFMALQTAASNHPSVRAASSIVGLGRGPYDDARVAQLAAATGGRYAFAGAGIDLAPGALVPAAAAAWDADARVVFDRAVVLRYRLLGHERHARDAEARRGTGATLSSGSPVTALYEVKLAKSSDGRPLGRLTLTASDLAGERLTQSVSIERAAVRPTYAAASAESRQALVAAALAEKLRGAYWVRGVTYAALEAQLGQIPAATPQLTALLAKARAVDTRGDAYAAQVPVAQMDFDHVPIVRR